MKIIAIEVPKVELSAIVGNKSSGGTLIPFTEPYKYNTPPKKRNIKFTSNKTEAKLNIFF